MHIPHQYPDSCTGWSPKVIPQNYLHLCQSHFFPILGNLPGFFLPLRFIQLYFAHAFQTEMEMWRERWTKLLLVIWRMVLRAWLGVIISSNWQVLIDLIFSYDRPEAFWVWLSLSSLSLFPLSLPSPSLSLSLSPPLSTSLSPPLSPPLSRWYCFLFVYMSAWRFFTFMLSYFYHYTMRI